MGKDSKILRLSLIVIVVATNVWLVKPALSQIGVTTPSTPSFGISYEFFTTNIPPVYGVDQLTGKAIVTKDGYSVFDERVYVYIVNQPFVPYGDSNENLVQLFYNIRWKDASNNSWVEPVRTTHSLTEERTVVTFGFKDNYHPTGNHPLDIPMGTETDFQVEALIGYYTVDNVFVGKTSGWTEPQSVQSAAIPENFVSPTSPAPSPTVPELSWLTLLPLCLLVLSVALVFRRKHKICEQTV